MSEQMDTQERRSSTAAHTPGPWSALPWESEAGGRDWNVWGPAPTNHIHDDNLRGDYGSEADARLIAAAPEMHDAHKENARIIGFLLNELQGRVDGGKLAALSGCLDRSKAALAKAEGRS